MIYPSLDEEQPGRRRAPERTDGTGSWNREWRHGVGDCKRLVRFLVRTEDAVAARR